MPVEDFPHNLQFYQIPFLLQHQFFVVLIINCPHIYLGRVIFRGYWEVRALPPPPKRKTNAQLLPQKYYHYGI